MSRRFRNMHGLPIHSSTRIKEIGRGYYYDMNMTRKHGGKTWIAPQSLIREDVGYDSGKQQGGAYRLDQKALYFPNVKGKSLGSGQEKDTTIMCFGRITVLSMLGTRMSEVRLHNAFLL